MRNTRASMSCRKGSGPDGTRTRNPNVANVVISQLIYRPKRLTAYPYRQHWATRGMSVERQVPDPLPEVHRRRVEPFLASPLEARVPALLHVVDGAGEHLYEIVPRDRRRRRGVAARDLAGQLDQLLVDVLPAEVRVGLAVLRRVPRAGDGRQDVRALATLGQRLGAEAELLDQPPRLVRVPRRLEDRDHRSAVGGGRR